MGLLAPAARVNGRRRYSQDHITRVAMIVGGKSGGLSLERRIRDIEGSKAMIEHALSCDEHDFTQCPGFRRLVERLADGGRLDATDHGPGRFHRPG